MLMIILGIVYVVGIFTVPFLVGVIKPDNDINFKDKDGLEMFLMFLWPLGIPLLLVWGVCVGVHYIMSRVLSKILLYGEYIGTQRQLKAEKRRRIKADLASRDFYEPPNVTSEKN